MTPAVPSLLPPALVATDLDGTLLRSDGTVSALTRSVLLGLADRGVPVVFVTARPLRWLDDLRPLAGVTGLAVVSNGALTYDLRARRPARVAGLSPDSGLALAGRISRRVPAAAFAIETLDGIALTPEYDEPNPVPPGSPVGPLARVWTGPALKLLVRAPGVSPETLRSGVADAVAERAVATWSIPELVEISARGVDKASGLAALCADLGVPASRVAAFGDMPNDLPMLAWAGASYAMGNAHPEVRAAARHVVPSNDGDGVARTLARIFGLDAARP